MGESVFKHAGAAVSLDDDGHLIDPGDWSPSLARAMASQDGIELTELHWEVIEFVRDYHQRYGNPPLMRLLIAAIRKSLGRPEFSSRDLYRLFTEHPIRQACRLGGYPKPDWCI